MMVRELISILGSKPPDAVVTVSGYEANTDRLTADNIVEGYSYRDPVPWGGDWSYPLPTEEALEARLEQNAEIIHVVLLGSTRSEIHMEVPGEVTVITATHTRRKNDKA